jgi:hypothetical protein
MTTALERTWSDDAPTRYAAAVALADEPGAAAAERLVALLDDDTSVCTDEGMSVYDVDPTYRPVSAAFEALQRMGPHAWPAMAKVWSGASLRARDHMVRVLPWLPLEERLRLPDDAFAALEAHVGASALSSVVFERALALRLRDGAVKDSALRDPEALWREVFDHHPNLYDRGRALVRFARVVTDPVVAARELHALLATPARAPRSDVLAAMLALPTVLPASLVRELVASPLVRQAPELWGWLARHGAAGHGVIPLCVEALQPSMAGGRPSWIGTTLDDRRWRLASAALTACGPLTPDVRATLLQRLVTTNETASLQGSLRSRLCELLGDLDRVEQDLAPQLEAMEHSGDPVDMERARQLRLRFQIARRPS